MYKSTETTKGSILKTDVETDIVTITETGEDLNSPIMVKLGDKWKQINEIIEEKQIKSETVINTIQTNAYIDEEGNKREEEIKCIFIISLEEEGKERNFSLMREGILKVKKILLKLSTNKTAWENAARKMLEKYYEDSHIQVKVHKPLRQKIEEAPDKDEEEWQTVQGRKEKTVIKFEEGQDKMKYAELVKTLTESINIKEIGVKVTILRENRDGITEMIVIGKQERKEFMNKIEDKMMYKASAQKTETTKRIFIKDIHETKTVEEVEIAIMKAAGDSELTS